MPEDTVLDWDSEIENDGQTFTLLPDGEYPFRVTKFERTRFGGSAKLSACWCAKLTLDVGDAEISTTMTCNLYLVQSQEWKLCSFFCCIGHRKRGEKFKPDWSKVVGSTGIAKVTTRTWKGNDGTDRQSNEIAHFLDPVIEENGVDDVPDW